MPIESNLNVSPYFDDFDQTKDYYKILFKPGVALQARELTQLQTLVQNQIERFGDHIFKSGTIVSGVNFHFNTKYDYVKVLDLQVDGQPVDLPGYDGLFVRNSSNLVAKIVNYQKGYQSRDPEVNYLFLKYINSGSTGNLGSYANDQVLTVYSDTYKLFDFAITNGSTGFSNSDSVELVSAVVVSSSNVAAGATISQTIGANTANVYVIESNTTFGSITVNGTTYSNTDGYKVLKVRPVFADLANSTLTSSKWTLYPNFNVVQGSNSAAVAATIGASATATLTTDGSGVITDVSATSGGSSYFIPPYVAIKSSTGAVSTVDITAQNYKTQLTVGSSALNASNTTPTGNGYAFSVTEGIIYQKGYFLRVDPQTVIVNAYSADVNNVTVGLTAIESIANNNTDTTLLDNATGTPNYTAPGADRLHIVPTLTVIASANVASNSTFFPLVEFRNGQPYKQNKTSVYNLLSKEFERRTAETSGNFVIDPFLIATKDASVYSDTSIDLVVDPGLAYIDGKRIETARNTYIPLRRATDTRTASNKTISLNYGSYVLVNEFAGYFDFKSGAEVDLYDTAKQFITTRATSITTAGTKIGTARVRSLALDSGIAGTSSARYRLYVFDVTMNQGQTFKDVRSIYQSGSQKGIADTVLTTDPTTGLSVASLQETTFNNLVFPTGNFAVKAVTGAEYRYSTSIVGESIGANGVLSVTVSSPSYFPYGNSVSLSTTQRRDITITPTSNSVSTNTVTSATATNGSAMISGSGLTSRFSVGDFVQVKNASNTSQSAVSTISYIANATHMSLSNTWSYATVSGTATVARFFPAFVSIPLDNSRVSANIDNAGTTLTVDIGDSSTVAFSANVDVNISFNAVRAEAQLTKSIARGLKVKINLGTHSANTTGPWCLGVPDAFRLVGVYAGSNSSVSTSDYDITHHFFIDNNQNEDYYGLSYLNLKHNNFSLGTTDYLLVEFDALTLGNDTDAGYFTVESYVLDDTGSSRSGLGNSAINIVEIPEFRNSKGEIFDLRDCIDFRPRALKTITLTDNSALANTNPDNTVTFGSHDKLFPAPDSQFTYSNEFYLQRTDRVVIDFNSDISIIEGVPSIDKTTPPEQPPSTITIGYINVPPYPSLPKVPSANTVELISKAIGTGYPIGYKASNYTVTEKVFKQFNAQPKRFTMADINKLERRVENLEYFTALTLLENNTKDISIPSAIDPSKNRFKNAFFVDQFEDYTQSDIQNSEFTATIDQLDGLLVAEKSSYNFQGRFNYDNTITKNNIHMEGDDYSEPGLSKWGEGVLMLPITGEQTVINQMQYTSAVAGNGTDIKSVGDITIEPSSFVVLLNAQVRNTDEEVNVTVTPTTPAQPIPPVPTYRDGLAISKLGKRVVNNYPTWFTSNQPDNTRFANTVVIKANENSENSVETFGYFKTDNSGDYMFRVYAHDLIKLWFGANAESGFTSSNPIISRDIVLGKLSGDDKVPIEATVTGLSANTYYAIRLHTGTNMACSHEAKLEFKVPSGAYTANGAGFYYYKTPARLSANTISRVEAPGREVHIGGSMSASVPNASRTGPSLLTNVKSIFRK